MATSEIDLAAGRAARDAGVETIKERRTREVEAVKRLILRVGEAMPVFTADDVRVRVGFALSHGNCVGAAFNSLANQKPPAIVGVGYTQSRAKKRHAGVIKQWSLSR